MLFRLTNALKGTKAPQKTISARYATTRQKGMYFCSINPINQSFMIRKLVYVLPVAVLLAGCDAKEKETLKSQVDSLKIELETSQKMANTLTEVGTLLDSIDA